MLNRNTASAHSELSAKSAYSTGTDGVQSEDDSSGALDLGENIDAATFEQVGRHSRGSGGEDWNWD